MSERKITGYSVVEGSSDDVQTLYELREDILLDGKKGYRFVAEFDYFDKEKAYQLCALLNGHYELTDDEVEDVEGDSQSNKVGGCDYVSFKEAERIFQTYIDNEWRDPNGMDKVAKAMLSYNRMLTHLRKRRLIRRGR